jgi:hypothetical protein
VSDATQSAVPVLAEFVSSRISHCTTNYFTSAEAVSDVSAFGAQRQTDVFGERLSAAGRSRDSRASGARSWSRCCPSAGHGSARRARRNAWPCSQRALPIKRLDLFHFRRPHPLGRRRRLHLAQPPFAPPENVPELHIRILQKPPFVSSRNPLAKATMNRTNPVLPTWIAIVATYW